MIGTLFTKTILKEHMETQDQMTAHKSRAIVLNCMDFRLIDDLERFLYSAGYNNNYDDFVLAGASLGYNQTVYPTWKDVFNTHVELAEQLHEIHEIIIIDHMNCGAYKKFYNRPSIPPEEERTLHRKNLNKMERVLKKKFPTLGVKKYLMNLDGSVEDLNNRN
jgi:carbonic anhydrase